jgi:hypothetical protein
MDIQQAGTNNWYSVCNVIPYRADDSSRWLLLAASCGQPDPLPVGPLSPAARRIAPAA